MKKLLLILLCLPMIGFGQISKNTKECISGDCVNGYGKIVLNPGKYPGDFINGIPNGNGRLELNEGNIYVGAFKKGTANGIGILYYSNGDKYEGQFKNGKEDGIGTLTYVRGKVYEGYFLFGLKNGDGAETDVNGDRYIGSFKENLKHGKGVEHVDGSVKNVKYYRGKLENQELLSHESKKGNKLIDQKIKFHNGDVYYGEYINSGKVGYGRMEYKNGDKYIGLWEKDLKHGNGTMYYDNGDEYSGNWQKGKRQGVGKLLKNGRKKSAGEYNGEWYNDKMHGEGTFLWKDSSLLTADFIEGMPTGRVEYQNAGEFKNNIDELDPDESYSYEGEIDLDFFRENWIVGPKGKGVLEYGSAKYGVDIAYWHSIQKYGRKVKGPSFNITSLAQANEHLSKSYIACEIPTAPPMLVISDIRFYDFDSDSILDPGETGKVSFTLKNEGKGTACNLIPKLSSHTSFNEIEIKNTKPIKKLQAGEERYVEINILALETASNNEIQLEIDIVEGNGFDLSPAIPLVISTQELLLPDIRVVDAEFYSENGGKVRKSSSVILKYIVQNLGQGKAEDVKVTFSVPTGIFEADLLDIELGRINSGKSKTLEFRFFVNNTFTGDNIDINLDIEEKNGKYASDTTLTVAFEHELLSAKKINFAVQKRKTDEILINKVSLNSLVDKDIPTNPKVDHRYALVIGNEDYSSSQRTLSSEQNVDYAINDATIFKQYCLKTLGVKDDNMFFLLDATSGQMSQEIDVISKILSKLGSKSELIVYYAGHGYPDEQTKIPYLIPVDVSATNLSSAIKLSEIYTKLSSTGASKVTVFLDACFTGGGRNSGLIASRGVKVKPKEGSLSGNLVVFSASSEDQSALPYHKEGHGMFTYHLLKKLQETKGDVSMGELSDYLDNNVSLQSLKKNKKEQDPKVNTSSKVINAWRNWKF